jgi:hypothetical protein
MRADPSLAGRCHGVDTGVSPTRAQTRAEEDQPEGAV